MSEMPMAVFAFEVSVVGTDWTEIVNARTSGAAKAGYWRRVSEAWPDVPFTAVRARKVGRPVSSNEFVRCAEYRGVVVRCGDRVTVGADRGVVIGHDASANFRVLFDADSPRFANQQLSVHPSDLGCEAPR